MQLHVDGHSVEYVRGISDIAERYDAFLVDVWGVLHDSAQAYPGAPECLQHLQRCGKRVILLSNAARRSLLLEEEFSAFGIFPSMYECIVSSGELTWQAFAAGGDPELEQLGKRYYLFGSAQYRLTEGLPLLRATNLAAADFLFAVGVAGSPQSTVEYEEVLQEAAGRGLPMVCANPDIWVVRNGVMGIAPGAVAARFEELGGKVIYFGKPYQAVYRRCFDILQGIAPRRIVAVGDALITDIAGAEAQKIDSLLVAGGIHQSQLKDIPEDSAGVAAICREHNHFPIMLAKAFIWKN